MMRLLCAVCLLLLATGCPSSNAAACPSTSTQAGDFTLALVLQPSAGQCRVTLNADSGPADGDVATAPAPQNATMCVGRDPDGGGDLLYMAVDNRTLRQSPFNPDGSFNFATLSSGIGGTVCGCAVDIGETITGVILPATPGGVFQIAPDGGQLTPAIETIQGSLVDTLDAGALTGCLCNIPCNLTYTMIGTKR